jgi:hypothetical protein
MSSVGDASLALETETRRTGTVYPISLGAPFKILAIMIFNHVSSNLPQRICAIKGKLFPIFDASIGPALETRRCAVWVKWLALALLEMALKLLVGRKPPVMACALVLLPC